MNAKISIRFARAILCVVLSLGYALPSSAITTNGNGGSTDVGTWYNQLMSFDPPSPYYTWGSAVFGVNDLPLISWSTISGSGALSGSYAQYDGSDSTVIANDLAALAAAKIDFIVLDMTNGGLAGICTSNNWTATYAAAVMAGVATWNSSHSWKIRVTFAVGALPCGVPGGSANIEAQAQDVYQNYANNATYGTPGNWYQINGSPVLVVYGSSASDWSTYCASNSCTYGNNFQLEYAAVQNAGAGAWGWGQSAAGTQVDPAGLVEQVSPGWMAYGGPWNPRSDGTLYQDNWDVVFNNALPRIVLLTTFNDWIEQQGFWINDTMTPGLIPSPPSNVSQFNARMPEVWTLPDGNMTLDGYWNYTVSAINYLRGGTSTRPSWPQPAANLAPVATLSASSCVGGDCTHPLFNLWPANAGDGNPSTFWSSDGHGSASATEWIQLHFASSQTFNTVVLMSRGDEPNCFPVSFQIQVWNTSTSSWVTVVQETNFPQPTVAGTPIAFTWGSSYSTTDVRVLATQLSPDEFGNYYLQLGEVEVKNEGSTATAPVLANWGFEQPALFGNGLTGSAYQSGPLTNGWTFNSSAGVQEVGSSKGSYMPPQGVQSAFLHDSSSSISQSVLFPAGSYVIRFLAAQQSGSGAQTIAVYFDATLIATVTPAGNNFAPYVTSSFASTGGVHTITFKGTASGGDGFLDEVQIFNTSSIGTNLLADSSWSSGSFSSWSLAGTTAAAYLTAGGGFNGDPYVLNENSTGGSFNVVAYQDFTGQPVGHTFTASVYAQTAASTTGAYVGVQDGSAGSFPYLCAGSIPSGVSSWTLYTCTGTVPSDGKLRFLLSSGTNSANNWTKYDNAFLIVQ